MIVLFKAYSNDWIPRQPFRVEYTSDDHQPRYRGRNEPC